MFLLPPPPPLQAANTCLKHSAHRQSSKGTNCSGSCNTCLDMTLDALCSNEAERSLIEQQHKHTHYLTFQCQINSGHLSHCHVTFVFSMVVDVSSCIYDSVLHPEVPVAQSFISELFICFLCLWFSCSAAAVVTLQPAYKIFRLAKEVYNERNRRGSRVSPEFLQTIHCTRITTLNWYCYCYLIS